MKTSARMLSLSLLAVAALLSVSIIAQTPIAPARGDDPPDGPGNRGGRGRQAGFTPPDPNAILATQIINQGDKDGDRKITSTELSALADAWFDKLDPGKAGSMSQEDFTQRFGGLIAAANPDGTGRGGLGGAGSPQAIGAGGRGGRGGFGGFGNSGLGLFLAADVDKDGTLTPDDLKASFAKWFAAWDSERSGALEEEKVRAGLTSTLPRENFGFGGRGARGGPGFGPGGPGGRGARGGADPDATADFAPKPPVLPIAGQEQKDKFLLPPGYRMELVLSDPHIAEPGAIAFDGNGRMFVLELRGYMQDADATGELDPVGRVSAHDDKDGDGVYETHSVFVDKLVFPRFVLPYGKDSVLTMESNADEVWKFTDTDGDGVGEKKELFAKGFRRGGNVEHQQSFLYWAMDNWLYLTVHSFRTRWDGSARENVGSNGAQWGVTQDNYGKLYFQGGASGLPSYFQLPILYGNFTVNGQIDPGMRVPHGLAGVADFQPGVGAAKKDGTLNEVTGSAGNDVYRGDRLPKDLVGDYLYGEPVGRIVRRIKAETTDGLTRMRNAYEPEKSEFIRSTDHLFRPVDMATAPDGTLYIADMYRGIIQEGNWTRPGTYLRRKIEQYELDKINSHGRIWRVTFDGIPRDRTKPNMLNVTTAQLVQHLEHPNGWWRDTAQQLLVLRQDKSVVPTLQSMARSSMNELGRIHALWTLEGLNSLDASLVGEALKSPNPNLRIQAMRLSEPLSKAGETSLEPGVRALAKDSDPNVAIQSLLTLNYLKAPKAEEFVRAAITATNSNRGLREIGNQMLQARGGSGFGQRGGPGGPGGPGGAQFSAAERETMGRGGRIYQELCFGCHGLDGKGTPVPDVAGGTLAPSMVGARRILGHRDYVINVLLHGLEGQVDGVTYTAGMVPMGSNTDEWIADVASYIRNSFGNSASFITKDDVAQARTAGGSRHTPWKIDELVAATSKILRYRPDWKISASHNSRMAGYAINSSGNYYWSTDEPQKADMWFQIEMPAPDQISELELLSGSSGPAVGFPRKYLLQTSDDGLAWSAPIAEGAGSAKTTLISFKPIRTKFLRITQTGAEENAPAWSIQKLRLYQPTETKVAASAK